MNVYRLEVGYKSQKDWSKPQMWLEMAIGAVAGGLFIASLLFEFSLGIIVALLLMLVGKGSLLLTDLGKPSRFILVLSRPGASWISKGAWGFFFFAVLGIIAVIPLVFQDLAWLPWAGVGKIVGVLAGLGAAFMMIYDGFSLADSKGVEFWRSAGLPIVFFFNAAAGGIGALMILAPLGGLTVSSEALAVVNCIVLAVNAVCLYAYIATAAKGVDGARESAEILTAGRLSATFWAGVVVVGIALPLVVSALALFGVSISAVVWMAIGFLEVIGVVALRYTVLNAGVYAPMI
jgi:formate-dependent nitrite reductase membrane component NrfD